MSQRKPQKKLLSHHRHTGRVLPRHHTSWPLVMLLLMMVGVLLTFATFQAHAADVSVRATAEGPVPSTPAVITSPQTGSDLKQSPIEVKGTCPAPYFVKVFRNQVFSGAAQCQNGTFTITIDLFAGENSLEARIYNAAGKEGPRSDPLTVTFGEEAGEQPISAEQPFFITSDVYFKANLDQPKMDWDFGIVGGQQPFTVQAAWGDDTISEQKDLMDNKFSASHVYGKSTEAREYYPVNITVTDTTGRKATLQVFNILNYSIPVATGSGSSDPTNTGLTPTDPQSPSMLRQALYAWPAYSAVTLMSASFWLGEQHTLAHAVSRIRIRRLPFLRK